VSNRDIGIGLAVLVGIMFLTGRKAEAQEPPPDEPPPEEPPPDEPPPEEPPPDEPPPEEPPPDKPPPPSDPFTFSNLRLERLRCQTATAWNTLDFWCSITNSSDQPITYILTPMFRIGTERGYSDPLLGEVYEFELTLDPGETFDYHLPGNHPDTCSVLIGFRAGVPYGGCVFLQDENGSTSPEICL